MVIYVQIFKIKKNSEPVPMLFITSLATSDLIMSIYMLVIGIADLIYRNDYANNAESWLRNSACTFACFLCCIASLMSVLMMLLISIDRYIYIAFPYSAYRVSPLHAKMLICIAWLFCIIFIGIPVAYSTNADGDSRLYAYTSICMASNFRNYFFRIWIIAYIFITLLCWFITSVLYVHMFIAIRQTAQAASTSPQENEKKIALRLSAIVITDLISWLPYYFYTIQVLIRPTASGILVLQFAIMLALPINSAINPYLYTLTSPAFIRSVRFSIRKYLRISRVGTYDNVNTLLPNTGSSTYALKESNT